MDFTSLDSLVAVVLAGSLAMERLVTILKTFMPRTFGEPGPAPEDVYKQEAYDRRSEEGESAKGLTRATGEKDATRRSHAVEPLAQYRVLGAVPTGYAEFEGRRIKVLLLVLTASVVTAYLLGQPETKDVPYRFVKAGENRIHWFLFGLLISGGSAFWSQVLGFVSAAKDVRATQRAQPQEPSPVIFVNRADPPRLDTGKRSDLPDTTDSA